MVVYIAEDHEIPWFQAALLSDSRPPAAAASAAAEPRRRADAIPDNARVPAAGGGSVNAFLEPKDKLGVAALTASIMRAGRHDVDDRRPDQRADGLPGRHA